MLIDKINRRLFGRLLLFVVSLDQNWKFSMINVPEPTVYLVIEETRPEGIIVSLMLQPTLFAFRRRNHCPLATFFSFPPLFLAVLFPRLFSLCPFFLLFFSLLSFPFFSLLSPFHLFPRAIGAFTLIKRPARDVYPGGVSVTSWARRVRWLNKPRQPRGPVGPPFRPTLPQQCRSFIPCSPKCTRSHRTT